MAADQGIEACLAYCSMFEPFSIAVGIERFEGYAPTTECGCIYFLDAEDTVTRESCGLSLPPEPCCPLFVGDLNTVCTGPDLIGDGHCLDSGWQIFCEKYWSGYDDYIAVGVTTVDECYDYCKGPIWSGKLPYESAGFNFYSTGVTYYSSGGPIPLTCQCITEHWQLEYTPPGSYFYGFTIFESNLQICAPAGSLPGSSSSSSSSVAPSTLSSVAPSTSSVTSATPSSSSLTSYTGTTTTHTGTGTNSGTSEPPTKTDSHHPTNTGGQGGQRGQGGSGGQGGQGGEGGQGGQGGSEGAGGKIGSGEGGTTTSSSELGSSTGFGSGYTGLHSNTAASISLSLFAVVAPFAVALL
jgi:hypothetical protein